MSANKFGPRDSLVMAGTEFRRHVQRVMFFSRETNPSAFVVVVFFGCQWSVHTMEILPLRT